MNIGEAISESVYRASSSALVSCNATFASSGVELEKWFALWL